MKYQHKPADIHIAWKLLLSFIAPIAIYFGFTTDTTSTFMKIVYALVGVITAFVILRVTWRRMEHPG